MFVFFQGYALHLLSPHVPGICWSHLYGNRSEGCWSAPPSCAQLSLSVLARGAAPSGSDLLSENRKEHYLKCNHKTGLKSREHCLPLTLLAAPKVNEHIRSQPGSNMVNALYGHQEWSLLARVQTAECYSPLVCFFVMGEKDRRLAFEIKLGSFPFKLLPVAQWKDALSNANTFTHTKKPKD